jgi:uncharacterized C2H2 Zn-finger protein
MAESPTNLNCPKCKFVGKSPQSLKVHIGRAHGAAKKTGTNRAARRRRRGRACELCGQILKTGPALKAHMTRMHAGQSFGEAKSASQRITPLDRDLMGLSLPALAQLFEAGKRELHRRLTGAPV